MASAKQRADPQHSFLSSSFDPEAVLTAETVSVPFSDVVPLDNLSACRRLLPPPLGSPEDGRLTCERCLGLWI